MIFKKLEVQFLLGATASKGTHFPKVVVISVTGGESVNGGVDDASAAASSSGARAMTRRYSGGPNTRSTRRIQVDVVAQFTTRDAAVPDPPYQFTPRAHQLHQQFHQHGP
jgi:hypothetical protein